MGKNSINLLSLKIDLNKFLNLIKDSKFESFRNLENTERYVDTFYLLNKNSKNQMFYLDNKEHLKSIEYSYNQKEDKINTTEAFYLTKIKVNNISQLILKEKQLKTLDTGKIYDIRDDLLYPILYQHFNVTNATFLNNKIIWEEVEQKELEFLNIYKDKRLTNEEKLEEFSKLLNIDLDDNSLTR